MNKIKFIMPLAGLATIPAIVMPLTSCDGGDDSSFVGPTIDPSKQIEATVAYTFANDHFDDTTTKKKPVKVLDECQCYADNKESAQAVKNLISNKFKVNLDDNLHYAGNYTDDATLELYNKAAISPALIQQIGTQLNGKFYLDGENLSTLYVSQDTTIFDGYLCISSEYYVFDSKGYTTGTMQQIVAIGNVSQTAGISFSLLLGGELVY